MKYVLLKGILSEQNEIIEERLAKIYDNAEANSSQNKKKRISETHRPRILPSRKAEWILFPAIYDLFSGGINKPRSAKWKEMKVKLGDLSIRSYVSEHQDFKDRGNWNCAKEGTLYMCNLVMKTESIVITGRDSSELARDFQRMTISNGLCVMMKSYKLTLTAFLGHKEEGGNHEEVDVVLPWVTHVLLILLKNTTT